MTFRILNGGDGTHVQGGRSAEGEHNAQMLRPENCRILSGALHYMQKAVGKDPTVSLEEPIEKQHAVMDEWLRATRSGGIVDQAANQKVKDLYEALPKAPGTNNAAAHKPPVHGGRSAVGEAHARRLTPDNRTAWARRSYAMARAIGQVWDGTDEGTEQLVTAYNTACDRYNRGQINALYDLEAAKVAQDMNVELTAAGCFIDGPDAA